MVEGAREGPTQQESRRSVRLTVGTVLCLLLALGVGYLVRQLRAQPVNGRFFAEGLAALTLGLLDLALLYRMAVLVTPRASLGLARRLAFVAGNRAILGLMLGSLALNLAIWGYLCLRYPHLPQLIPLHYTAGGEVDRIGYARELFALPAIGLLVLLANCAVAFATFRAKPLAAYMLLGTTTAVQLLLSTAAVRLAI